MASINNINTNILKHILFYVAAEHSENLDKWIPKLRLLHVCSEWTGILEPLVLCKGFVDICSVSPKKVTINGSEIPQTVCRTNAGIILKRGFRDFVDTFSITSSVYIKYSDFFKHVFDALQSDQHEWIGVQALDLEMVTDWDEMQKNLDIDAQDLEDERCTQYAQEFYRCMPKIKRLLLKEPIEDSGSLANKMANIYAHQLIQLISPNPISLLRSKLCPNLTFLKLKLDLKVKPLFLPYLRAAPLKYLDLFNVPPEFSWAEFYDADGCNIRFENLHTLCLGYIATPKKKTTAGLSTKDSDLQKPRFIYYRLHFPVLSILRLYSCPAACEMLYCQEYFKNLSRALIGGSIDSVARAIDMGLNSPAELKVLVIEALSDQDKLFYDTTNALFGKQNATKSSFFLVDSDISWIDPEAIQWPMLTILCINTPIDVDKYLRLVARLPSLSVTAAHRLTVSKEICIMYGSENTVGFKDGVSEFADGVSGNYSKASSQFQRVVPVSDSKLFELSLFFDDKDNDNDQSDCRYEIKSWIAAYAVAKFPLLENLIIDPALQECFERQMLELGRSCAHTKYANILYASADKVKFYLSHQFYLLD